MRDALDHLIWEMTAANTGHALPGTGWPIIRRRADWSLTGKNGRPNNRSGEYKIRGIHPKYWSGVKSHQPFYRKRKDDVSPIHALWVLDELRNLDRHRRLAVVPVRRGGDTHHNRSTRSRRSRTRSRALPCQASQRRIGNRTLANGARAHGVGHSNSRRGH